MKMRLEDKRKAIELRIQGKTYREIQFLIPNLPKATISNWLSNLRLTPIQEKVLKKHLKEVNYSAKVKSAWVKKEAKKERIKKYFHEAEKEYITLSKNPFFLICLSLYWAEGNKKTEFFQFTNSDPRAIKAIMRWLITLCGIPKKDIKFRLYMHKIYAHENPEKFWSKITKIPISDFQKTIFKETPHKIKKNIDYKGCVQLRVFKTGFYWKMVGWIQLLIKEYELD